MTQKQTGEVAPERATSFSAAEGDATPPTSMKVFGSIYIVLWLGMLAFIYLARRHQRMLKVQLQRAEALLSDDRAA